MKSIIFCASIFLFAAANASPYHVGYKRSDDQDVKAPATVLSSGAIADPAAASTATAAIDDHPPKILDKIKSAMNFLSKRNVGVVVIREEPREVVEERWKVAHPVVIREEPREVVEERWGPMPVAHIAEYGR